MFKQYKNGDKSESQELSIKQREMSFAYERDTYERQFSKLGKVSPKNVSPTPYNSPRRKPE